MSIWSSSLSGIFDKTKLPGVSVDISYMTPVSSVLASALKFLNLPGFPKVKFSKMALGGIVDPGQLFLAREAGPELVGAIGSHTAVMNNNMIVESVKGGVVNGVLGFVEKRKSILVNFVEKKFIKIEKNFDQTPKTFPIRMKGEKPSKRNNEKPFLCMETVA